jgi:hypothetical protein
MPRHCVCFSTNKNPIDIHTPVRLVMGEIEIRAKKTKPRIHSQFSPVHLVLNKFMGPPIQ